MTQTKLMKPAIDYSIPAMRELRKRPVDDGIRAEVIYGKLYLTGAPTLYHQRVLARIFNALTNYVQASDLGEVFVAPLGIVLLKGTNYVQPDILFVSKENSPIMYRDAIYGPPDLQIEILSPGTRKRDLTIKKKLYEEAGVKEYWLVEPDTKDAWGYLLDGNRYDEPLVMNSKLHVRILDKIIDF